MLFWVKNNKFFIYALSGLLVLVLVVGFFSQWDGSLLFASKNECGMTAHCTPPRYLDNSVILGIY